MTWEPGTDNGWKGSPLSDGDDLEDKYTISYGGQGPTPGSANAKSQGCTCPGQVGDKDRWGCVGGHTIHEGCLFHGKEARKKHLAQVRKEQAAFWAEMDEMDRRREAGERWQWPAPSSTVNE